MVYLCYCLYVIAFVVAIVASYGFFDGMALNTIKGVTNIAGWLVVLYIIFNIPVKMIENGYIITSGRGF